MPHHWWKYTFFKLYDINRQLESEFPENCIWVSSLSFLTLTPVVPLKMMHPDFGCDIILATSARCYYEKVQIEYALSPTGSWVCTVGLQLVMLFWKVVEPLLRGRASLEEKVPGGGLWGFTDQTYFLSLSVSCSTSIQEVNSLALCPWWTASPHTGSQTSPPSSKLFFTGI